jgi:hypothetical protein
MRHRRLRAQAARRMAGRAARSPRPDPPGQRQARRTSHRRPRGRTIATRRVAPTRDPHASAWPTARPSRSFARRAIADSNCSSNRQDCVARSPSTRVGKSSGNANTGMSCGTETTNPPDSTAMWRIEATLASESSAEGAIQICGRVGKSHAARAASGSPSRSGRRPCDGRVDGTEVAAVAEAVEETLVHRRGVPGRSVTRSLTLRRSRRRARRRPPRCARCGPGDVDGVMPQALPELTPAVEGRGAPGPGVVGVERHERLGQHDQPGAVLSGLAEQTERLLERRLGGRGSPDSPGRRRPTRWWRRSHGPSPSWRRIETESE